MTELRYLLDTDTCIYIINRQPAEVRDRFTHLAPGSVAISVITYHELCFGALQSRHTEKNLQALQQFTHRVPALPWSTEAAIQTARLRLALNHSGQPIGSWDMQIAGHALALNLGLVNEQHTRIRSYRASTGRNLGAVQHKNLLGSVDGCHHSSVLRMTPRTHRAGGTGARGWRLRPETWKD